MFYVRKYTQIYRLTNFLPIFHSGDMSNELVRHFLIECTQKGVRLKGCPNEPYFGEFLPSWNMFSLFGPPTPCRVLPSSGVL